jgi:uncharacterized protein (TIGR03437 family)
VFAQSISVTNFLHPEAPVARDSFAAIEGSNFSDEQLVEPFSPPTTLGGVSVRMDGAPQRIRSVSPTRVVFLVDPAGLADRTVELTTKAGVKHTARMRVATAWPSLFVQATGDDSEAYIPSGLWTLDGIQLRPITSAPVPVGSSSRPTLVILQGSGWRNALAIAGGVQVRLNGIPCPVIAARASALFAGQDELVFQIPAYLAGRGEMDVTVSVAGRNSNYARINLGAAAAFNAASGKASGKTTTSFKRQNR